VVVLRRQPDIGTCVVDVLFSVEVRVSVSTMVVDVSECLWRDASAVNGVSDKHHMPDYSQSYVRRGLEVLV
jgi:hypothetical protein